VTQNTAAAQNTLKGVPVALLLLLSGSLFLQPRALADDTLMLTGLVTGFSMGGVYTSPYIITVDGKPTDLVCDDFTTDISFGQTWNATQYTLASVTSSGPQKFTAPNVTLPDGTTLSETIQTKYGAAASLAETLLTTPSILANSTLAGEYSFAIWQIFYAQATDGWNRNPLTSAQKTAVGTLISNALVAAANSPLPTNVYVYTPDPTGAAQEFFGFAPGSTFQTFPVPEASIPTFLAFDFLALAIVVFLRRQLQPTR